MKPEGSSDRNHQNNDDDYIECVRKGTGCKHENCCDGRGHYQDGRGHYPEEGEIKSCGYYAPSERYIWTL